MVWGKVVVHKHAEYWLEKEGADAVHEENSSNETIEKYGRTEAELAKGASQHWTRRALTKRSDR